MRIDSSGNVGIGATPQSHYTGYTALDLGASGSIWSNRTTSDTNTIMMANNAYLNSGATSWLRIHTDEATRYEQGSGLHRWFYAASGTAGSAISWSEAMRIDSSGNLLVGTTDNNVGNNSGSSNSGFNVTSSGEIKVASASGSVFNRLATDGSIIDFKKDGTTVGSIGNSGGAMYISAAATGGLKWTYLNGTNAVTQPCNTTGTTTDGTHDLGTSGARFRDLYLSGGVYLGGTGSANKLDDYEEGTWTPTLTGITPTTATGTYVKVGKICYIGIFINLGSQTSTGSAEITGFPFTVADDNDARAGLTISYSTYTTPLTFLLNNNSAVGLLRAFGGGIQTCNTLSGKVFHIGGTYQTV
jgi:hypothetical protein